MIRISASDLVGFQYWKDREDATLEDLVARLTHTEESPPRVDAGAALARIFEHAGNRLLDVEEQDGWTFHFDLDAEISLPPVRELKGEMLFDTPSGPVTLVGKVDSLDGLRVRDQKLTTDFDAERYTDSLQWRVYLAMHSALAFTYDVFVAKYHEKKGVLTREITVREYHPLTFYSYPGIETDVRSAVCELAEVITRYIPQLVKEAA